MQIDFFSEEEWKKLELYEKVIIDTAFERLVEVSQELSQPIENIVFYEMELNLDIFYVNEDINNECWVAEDSEGFQFFIDEGTYGSEELELVGDWLEDKWPEDSDGCFEFCTKFYQRIAVRFKDNLIKSGLKTSDNLQVYLIMEDETDVEKNYYDNAIQGAQIEISKYLQEI